MHAQPEVWEDGADQEDEYDEKVICGQCDKLFVKVATDPRMPTQREIDEHCVTKLPHRSWCEVCIKACGRESARAIQNEKKAKPTIAMEFGEAEETEDKIKTIILKDKSMAAERFGGSTSSSAHPRRHHDVRSHGHHHEG